MVPECYEKTEDDQFPHVLRRAHEDGAGAEQDDADHENVDP